MNFYRYENYENFIPGQLYLMRREIGPKLMVNFHDMKKIVEIYSNDVLMFLTVHKYEESSIEWQAFLTKNGEIVVSPGMGYDLEKFET